jgi:hypothetical protein
MKAKMTIIIKYLLITVMMFFVFTSFPNFAYIIIDWLTVIVNARVEVDLILNDFWRGLKS